MITQEEADKRYVRLNRESQLFICSSLMYFNQLDLINAREYVLKNCEIIGWNMTDEENINFMTTEIDDMINFYRFLLEHAFFKRSSK